MGSTGWLVFQPFGEPCVDGILPAYTLLITYDTMILAIHLHEFHGLS